MASMLHLLINVWNCLPHNSLCSCGVTKTAPNFKIRKIWEFRFLANGKAGMKNELGKTEGKAWIIRISLDPFGRPSVTAGSEYCFRTYCPSVHPHFSKSSITKQISSENNVNYSGSGRVDHWWHLSCFPSLHFQQLYNFPITFNDANWLWKCCFTNYLLIDDLFIWVFLASILRLSCFASVKLHLISSPCARNAFHCLESLGGYFFLIFFLELWVC